MQKGFGILSCDKCNKLLSKEAIVYRIKKAFKLTGFSRRKELMFKTYCSNCYNKLFEM